MANLLMTYEQAKARAEELNEACNVAGKALGKFPKGPMGLTPDAVKHSTEFKTAKAIFDLAFARLRAFNSIYVKQFARERREERKRFLRANAHPHATT